MGPPTPLRSTRSLHASSLSTPMRVLCAATLLAACLLPGCYQRVVAAKGFGADQVRVAEPYQESGQLDDWIFGPQNTIQRRRGSMLR